VCNLVIFSERSSFVDAVNYLSGCQTAVFHLKNISYCEETTIKLIGFLKVGQVSECTVVNARPSHIVLQPVTLVVAELCLTRLLRFKTFDTRYTGLHEAGVFAPDSFLQPGAQTPVPV